MKISATLLGTLVVGLSTLNTGVRAGDLPGPIHSLQDAQDSGRILYKLADTNNDGQISQKEATDAGNLIVGGFFFRADANGDGVLSQEEAKQARESLYVQQPMLRYFIQKAETMKPAGNNATTDPAKAIGSLLDINNDKQLQATEVRQAVQTAVQTLYATADTNRDGQMSPTEVNAAIEGLAVALAKAEMQMADKDGNGQISQQEFEQAAIEPARYVFKLLDTNNDGQISAEESKSAEQFIVAQIRALYVPEPANSVRRMIQSGNRPDQIAPIPAFSTPARGVQAQPGQPAAPAAQPRAGQPVAPPQPK